MTSPRGGELASPAASGFVLAGGLSSRMGRDKALVELLGMPLIAHALAVFRTLGLPASIAGARAPLSAFAPVIPDSSSGLGPLSGIVAALATVPSGHAVFLPVDAPLLPASLLEHLLTRACRTAAPAVFVSLNGRAETFPLVLHASLLPGLRAALASQNDADRGCLAAVRAACLALGREPSILPVEALVQAGQVRHPQALPPSRWFLNVNTLGDLDLAARLLAAPLQVS